MPARPHPFSCHDHLELRYDGPVPGAASGSPHARARLFARLAAEARHSTAYRRSALNADAATDDPRLGELSLALSLYRRHGIAWMP